MKWYDTMLVGALCLVNGAVWGWATGSGKVGAAIAVTSVVALAVNDLVRPRK